MSPAQFLPISLCLLIFLTPAAKAAEPGITAAPAMDPKPVLDVPYASQAPVWSPEKRDPIWDKAATIPGLTLSIGDAMKGRDTKPTRIYLLWNETTLFIRFECEASGLYTPKQGRDATLYHGDVVEVFLDPEGLGKTYYEFQGNALGDIFDQQIQIDTEPAYTPLNRLKDEIVSKHFHPDVAWNLKDITINSTILRDQETIKGWVVEFGFPAKGLLGTNGPDTYKAGQEIRANLLRYDYLSPNEKGNRPLVAMNWSPVVFGCPHISAAAMGTLRLKASP